MKDGGEHEAFFEPDSQIAKRLGGLSATVNSTHHQSVKTPGRGFRVTARAADGVVEAIENTEYPAAAVQFHPERLVVQKGRPEFSALLDFEIFPKEYKCPKEYKYQADGSKEKLIKAMEEMK